MAGQNPGSPTDFQYFYEDEVYKINNRGQVVFGLVLENYEANSSDQESDIDIPIQKGEIRVVWHPSGTERVITEKSVSKIHCPLSFPHADKAESQVACIELHCCVFGMIILLWCSYPSALGIIIEHSGIMIDMGVNR